MNIFLEWSGRPAKRVPGGGVALVAILVACALFGPGAASSVFAQDDIGTLYNKSVQAMNESKWEEALALADKIIEDFGEFAYDDFGAMFGGIYYNKGISQMKLQDYAEAAEAFKTSHEQFPNKKPEGKEDAPESNNPYWKTSVFQWALSRQLVQEYADAVTLYKKFEALKPDPQELQPGAYFINLGICQANTGDLAAATASIQKVFDNRVAYRVSPVYLLQGFVQLGGAWVKLAGENPDVLKSANEFMDTYLPTLRIRAFEMQRYNTLVVQLAQEAGTAKQFGLAVRFYSLYAGVREAILDLTIRSVEYGGITTKLQQEIDKLEALIDSGDPLDVNVLRGLAAAQEGLGNIRASYVIHQNLEQEYPVSKVRPEILFHATRGAATLGDVPATMEFGMEFLKKYPDHELYDKISNLLIGALFERQEYQRCVDLALDIRESLPVESESRDLVEFILGASYYYLQENETAQPILDAHVADYPESQFLVNSGYFQASNMIKLQKFSEAAKLFDAYIEKFPVSPLLDIALFERAMCEYLIQEEAFDVALELIDRLEKEFPNSSVLPSALILRGDIQKTYNEMETAGAAYVATLEAAERLGNAPVAGEALSKLIDVEVGLEKWEEAARHYDDFFAKYSDTEFKLTAAVVGLEALKRVDRAEDGLSRLEEMIVAMSSESSGDGMERAVNSYVSVSAEMRGADETIARLENFPGLEGDGGTLRAWLLVSKVELLQDQLKSLNKDDPGYGAKEALVKAAFNELKDYDRSDLGNYILIQVGRYIVNTGNPFEAKPFFQEILDRDNKEFEDYALLDLAKIDARSPDKAVQDRAIKAFKRVIEVFGTKDLIEDSYIGLGRLYADREDWDGTLDLYQKYQKNKSFKKHRPEANYMIGRAYEGKGDLTRAQKVYVNVFVLYRGHLEWSAQAALRNANIEFAKGNPKAQHNAYEMLRDLERILGPYEDRDEEGWTRRGVRRLDEIREELGITAEMEAAEERAAKEGKK
ncbi:MAG: tetratricopeptide repeat protein [Verrucomicrobiales bacterium]